MHELTQLIKDDMRPALGVTEPGAIAYAVSKAKSYVPGELEQVTLLLNSGIYMWYPEQPFLRERIRSSSWSRSRETGERAGESC